MSLRTTLASLVLVSGTFLLAANGCGSDDSTFLEGKGDGGSSGSSGSFGPGGDGGGGGDAKPCTGLCLRQKTCAGGGTTSLSGTVTDPAGKVPLYNVIVYVPNAPLGPITNGASCDRCGSVSGDPLVVTLTGIDGKFTLKNVPVGADVPLVIQVGKWRRQITIANVPECVDTPLDASRIRLPRNKSEGDMPQIALTTGGEDLYECFLKKMGIDEAEFTTHTGGGRVHLFKGGGAAAVGQFAATHNGGANFGAASDFWGTTASLMKYDMVIMACEGITDPASKPPAALAAMKEFANAGGRIFASHWHRYWFNTKERVKQGSEPPSDPAGAPSPFEDFASWDDDPLYPVDPAFGTINTSFAKGKAMHDWLKQPAVAGLCPISPTCDTSQNEKLPIVKARDNLVTIDETKTTSWITIPGPATPAHEYISVNTPIPAPDDQKCGRIVYTNLHVTTADTHQPWPSGCTTTELTPQEKAIEFMFFDLASCIQPDKEEPVIPGPK